MKSTQRLVLFVMVLLWKAGFVFAQTSGTVGTAALTGAQEVGVAAAVRGGVELARGGQVGHVVASGEAVYLEDAVSTDAQGALQILLLDQTAFTIGPNSSIVINRFVYDPKTGAGKVDARIVKGTFRFITGKIARKRPEDMTIALPAGTIGIRGTMAMGKVNGEQSLVVLTGPGKQNNTGNKQGELVVGNDVGNEKKSVNLTKTGYGTVIEGVGKGPSAPFKVPEAQLQELTQSLSPQGEGSGEEGVEDSESATEQSGQDVADTGEDSSDSIATGGFSQSLAEESAKASQNASNSLNIQDGTTTVQQLLSITTGQFRFENAIGIPLSPGGGTFDIHYNLDFGARTVGGGQSRINGSGNSNIEGSSIFSIKLPVRNFSDGEGGLAIHTYQGLTDSGCVGCTANVTVTAVNAGGVIAANGTVSASIVDGGPTVTGSGSGGRTTGLST
jgi:hypothetical protein